MAVGALLAASVSATIGWFIGDPHTVLLLTGATTPVGTFGGALVASKRWDARSRALLAPGVAERLEILENEYVLKKDQIDALNVPEANKEELLLDAYKRYSAKRDEIMDGELTVDERAPKKLKALAGG
jgi:hypothetical protein